MKKVFFLICWFLNMQGFAQNEMPRIEMILVHGGSFTMGDKNLSPKEDEPHRVTLDAFYIGKFEVTQAQWTAIMGKNPSKFKGDSLPVSQVTWENVQEFIQKLNEKTGKKYRLPTEAEWEFAARGGLNGNSCKYSGVRPTGYVPGRYEARNTNCASLEQCVCNSVETCPVGSKWPNELGIYDMSGNVMEWCYDWNENFTKEAVVNPKGPENGIKRVIRGGDFTKGSVFDNIFWRNRDYPDYLDRLLGFRLAHSAEGF